MKTASSITDYLIKTDEFNPNTCTSFLQKSLKKKADTVIESIEGYQMTQAQKERIFLIRSHQEFIEKVITELYKRLDKLVKPYENAIQLLFTIPGIERQSAIIAIDRMVLTAIFHILSTYTSFNCIRILDLKKI